MSGNEPQDENKNDPNAPSEPDLSEIENDVEESPLAGLPVSSKTYDIPLDQLLSDEIDPLTPDDIKKLKQIGFGTLGIIVLIIMLCIYGCQPKEGPQAYGLCSTFLELHTPYPHTLTYVDLEGSKTAIRIYYTSIDPFGQFRQETIECKFGADEKMGMKITEILRNRRPVDAELVKEFNMTLPAVMTGEPYLVVPGPDWENQLIPD